MPELKRRKKAFNQRNVENQQVQYKQEWYNCMGAIYGMLVETKLRSLFTAEFKLIIQMLGVSANSAARSVSFQSARTPIKYFDKNENTVAASIKHE